MLEGALYLLLGAMTLPAISAVLDGDVLLIRELLVLLALENLVELSLSGVLADSAEEVGNILAEHLALVELVKDVKGLLGLC